MAILRKLETSSLRTSSRFGTDSAVRAEHATDELTVDVELRELVEPADRLAGDEQKRELELLGLRRGPRARGLVVGDVEDLERDLLGGEQLFDLLLAAVVLAVEV